MTRLAFLIAVLIAFLFPLSGHASPGIPVTATAYSCEAHPDNPMFSPGMCIVTAHGGDPHQPGIACPDDWAGRVYYVPGFGRLICDDTPYRRTLFGLPHVDIRVPTYQMALVVGIGEMWIYDAPVTRGWFKGDLRWSYSTKFNPYTGMASR